MSPIFEHLRFLWLNSKNNVKIKSLTGAFFGMSLVHLLSGAAKRMNDAFGGEAPNNKQEDVLRMQFYLNFKFDTVVYRLWWGIYEQ